MAHEIFVTFETFAFDNLSSWTATVHCVRRHQIQAIGRPWQSQYVRCPTAFFKRFGDRCLTRPVGCFPNANRSIVTLRCHVFANRIPGNTFHQTRVSFKYIYNCRHCLHIPNDDRIVNAGTGQPTILRWPWQIQYVTFSMKIKKNLYFNLFKLF